MEMRLLLLLKSSGSKGIYVHTNVADSQSVENAVKAAISVFGRLDFAHNNAGIRAVANIADLAESDWKKVIDVNLTGVFLGMKYQIPEILKTQGAIVNTASIFGMKGVPERSAYAASKAGVISLTMTAASEYAETRDSGQCGCSRFHCDRGSAKDVRKWRTTIDCQNSKKKTRKSNRYSEAVVWLCSSYSPNVNGIVLPVDGGYMAN